MSKLGFGQNNKRYGLMKLVFVLSFATLVGIALFAHFLRTSSSSISFTYQSIASLNRAAEKPADNIVASDSQDHQKEGSEHKNGSVEGRVLSATFADLPAPELEWEQMPSAPVPRLDGYSVQIKNLFYVFVGYRNLDHVHSHVDVYNFSDNTWCDRFDTPKDMANSHLGVATDGRYVYIVSGQNGTQCRTAITTCFSLDTETRKWHRLPPLPAPRYAPATQLWRGRLQVMGGSKENRHTPGLDHWSIAVKNGKALDGWRTETPIPRGGPHRYACCLHLWPVLWSMIGFWSLVVKRAISWRNPGRLFSSVLEGKR
ncbi:kelch repeat-containing protein [Salix suchowensis]|nr:kelch repeat-containing protein [Salix suchowensis]